MIKLTNNAVKSALLVAYITVTAFSANASAAVLDFGTGLSGSGGTITDVDSDGSHIIGAGINIGSFEAVGTGATDGVYVVTDGLLNFDTDDNTITVTGSITDLSLGPITFLTGSFNSWSYDDSATIVNFSGGGTDTKHDDLLTALGLSLDTQFEFFGFSLAFNTGAADPATAISSDILNTTVVPVPAAVWLFGSGLLGLVGIARRRK